MTTFLLVHGAWHGGWVWRRVVPHLRAAGHEVFTPTLTGLGERAHLLTPKVDLSTHVDDVVGVLFCEDLRDVVLVGHSYGGMLVTAVGGVAPDRVAHFVYLDAFVPREGESLFDLLKPERCAMFREQAREQGSGWLIPPPSPENWGVTAADDLRWLRAKLRPHPIKTFEQPLLHHVPPADDGPIRTFIWCTEYLTHARVAERIQADNTWRYRELVTGHDAMVTAPAVLSRLLLELG